MILQLSRLRGEMDIIQVSGTWGPGSIPGEGNASYSTVHTSTHAKKWDISPGAGSGGSHGSEEDSGSGR